MNAVVELICALVASLAAAVFAQFGITVHTGPVEHSRPPEVQRTMSRLDRRAENTLVNPPSEPCQQVRA